MHELTISDQEATEHSTVSDEQPDNAEHQAAEQSGNESHPDEQNAAKTHLDGQKHQEGIQDILCGPPCSSILTFLHNEIRMLRSKLIGNPKDFVMLHIAPKGCEHYAEEGEFLFKHNLAVIAKLFLPM